MEQGSSDLEERVAALERAEGVATARDMVVIRGRLVRIERKLERLMKLFRIPEDRAP